MSNWDIKSLSSEVGYRVVGTDGGIQAILYENEPFLGKPTEVFAYMGVPGGVRGQVPGMVCVHGGGGRAFKQWVELWLARGYAAIAMDLGGRDANNERFANSGPEQDHEAKFSTTLAWHDLWTYHAVAAVMRANTILRSQASVDAGRIGITGISWGGYLTCIAAGVDARFACAIPVYGCGFLQHNSAEEWMRIFSNMTREQRRAWHEKCDPSVYLKDAAMPMLFVSGTNDFAYPLDSLEMSCALPTGEVTRCVRVEMPHGHEAGWSPIEIGIFTDQHLAGGVPLPAISTCELTQGSLKAGFSSACPIRHGSLVYTTNTCTWRERKWQATAATLNGGLVKAALPKDATACFLAIEDNRGAYVSSPHLSIG